MNMRRIAVATTTAALLAAAPAAQAHISLHPNTIPAGAFVTLNVRVPGEVQGAYAYKVDMLLPDGFTDVNTQNVPGWTIKVITKNVNPPIQTPDGPVSQEISQIVWTGDRSQLGRIDNNFFMQFPLQITIPDNLAGQALAFKTLEYYSNGTVASWIGPPSADYPAPTVNITPKGGVIEDVAGDEAGPTPSQTGGSTAKPTTTTATSSSSSDNGLAIAALVVAVLALIAAAVSLRRRR
jgi:uncharacterized protein YcnI